MLGIQIPQNNGYKKKDLNYKVVIEMDWEDNNEGNDGRNGMKFIDRTEKKP